MVGSACFNVQAAQPLFLDFYTAHADGERLYGTAVFKSLNLHGVDLQALGLVS